MFRLRIVLTAAFLTLLAACAYQPPETFSEFKMTGEIVSLDAAAKHARIRHEDIKGRDGKLWMGAMTMEFPVKQPAEFARLRVGMRLHAKVVQRDSDLTYWIEAIRELPAAAAAPN